MDTPFIYDKYVTGKYFLGRKNDCSILGNFLFQGENVVIYDAPKTGKTSVIQQTLFNLRITGKQFLSARVSLLSIRSEAAFLVRLGGAVLHCAASTPTEFAALVEKYLAGTHFVFDPQALQDRDEPVSLNWDPDENDLLEMLRLPARLAREKGSAIYVILTEFQNLQFVEDPDRIYRAMETVFDENRSAERPKCSFLLCGSGVNAMKDIFEHRRFFYRKVERIVLEPFDEKEIIDHIVRGFLSGGKVIERELLQGVCRLFRCNMWYINHFISICDALSKGYIVESTLLDALDIVMSTQEPRFRATVNHLTTHQIHLLRAILEGVTKFSTAEVIAAYGLNSSANVKRIKDALMKKEIVTFNEKDEAEILDPLFEYWLSKVFFEMKG